mgnify:CR=1 FL=1
MPRGNLEGIYPRLIVLHKVIEDIEAKKYGKAFKALRQHKIDINLIYDVNPELFLANVPLFVAEVQKVDYLNLFINSLVDDDQGSELAFMRPLDPEEVIKREHKEFMAEINSQGQEVTGKINKICNALKTELLLKNQNNFYLLPILTIYVKKQP